VSGRLEQAALVPSTSAMSSIDLPADARTGAGAAPRPPARLAADAPLCIVFNLASGSGDALRNQREMQRILTSAERRHEFFLVRQPRELTTLVRRATERAVQQAGAVIAAGGDGTINAVVQAMLDTGRPLGVVPQGTFNYFCRAHAIPLETEAATRALLHPRLRPAQVGLANERVFLVNASLGLYPQLLQNREAFTRQLGRYRAVAVLSALATILRGSGRLTLELEHGRQREVVTTPSLFIGNNALQLEQVGLPEAEAVQRRKLAAVIVRAETPLALLRVFVDGALGRLGEAQAVHDFAFQRMTVRATARGVRRLKIAVDGEVVWMKPPVVFSIATEPLWLLTPEHPASPVDA
jgi:diacylglycerol kinase family enzyme